MWNGKIQLLGILSLIIALGIWYYFRWNVRQSPDIAESAAKRVQAFYVQMEEMGVTRNQFTLFLRAFKAEQELEVWVSDGQEKAFQHLVTYPICKSSGDLGPKRREGDLQVPEGCYHIDRMNPNSAYHLSLGLNYPNASDRIRGDQQEPGSDIFIHGGCVTVGCLPITDTKIEELYMMVSQAMDNGQQRVPVHIFPGRLESAVFAPHLNTSPHQAFWQELLPIYQYFERYQKMPPFTINKKDGSYQL